MWNRSENQIECILLRHGKTLSNEQGRYLGQTDETLSEQGRRQLQCRKREEAYGKVDVWIASPLKRCLETAAIVWPDTTGMVIPQFGEMHFGEWEGKCYAELIEDARYQRWLDQKGEPAFPGGESRKEFVERTLVGWKFFLQKLESEKSLKEAKTIGFAIHGGTIMALCSALLGGNYYDYQIGNGETYRLLLNRDTKEVERKGTVGR